MNSKVNLIVGKQKSDVVHVKILQFVHTSQGLITSFLHFGQPNMKALPGSLTYFTDTFLTDKQLAFMPAGQSITFLAEVPSMKTHRQKNSSL